jgi:vanillate O-demethylase ferredoxin subunit
MATLSVRVNRKHREAEDIFSFELTDIDGRQLPRFTAGAHIDIQLPNGLTRQYSLCNSPAEQHRYLIAVLRDPKSRGGSVMMHDVVNEGDIVGISEPRNCFPLAPARQTILLAGGIGVTPILCMAEHLQQSGNAFEMHYCSRSETRSAFRERIAASAFASNVRFYFDDGPGAQPLDARAVLRNAAADAHVYVCGPSGFIDHILGAARDHGIDESRLHREYFGAAPANAAGEAPFEVELARTGKVVSIPAHRSIVEVLADHGVSVPTSCEQGVCGTCLTRVLGGTPDHRDTYLTDEERSANEQCTPCCSRSRSPRLVLDL